MPKEITWMVTEASGEVRKSAEPKRKARYSSKQRVTADMNESRKAGVDIWNDWYEVLKENDLLQDKPE